MEHSPQPSFNLTTQPTIINETHYRLLVCTAHITHVRSLTYSRIIFNDTITEHTTVFLHDHSVVSAEPNNWSPLQRSFSSAYNVIVGVSSFAFLGVHNWWNFNGTAMKVSAWSPGIEFVEKVQFQPLVYECPKERPHLFTETMLCYEICPEGTQLVDKRCVRCSVGCISCQGRTCFMCNEENHYQLSQNGECQCTEGHYPLDEKCVACPLGCSRCDSEYNCMGCDASNHFTMIDGVCGCNSTAGEVLFDTECVSCGVVLSMCSNCTSKTECTACEAVPHIILDEGMCKCQFGYYLSDSMCLQCNIARCANCESESVCLECIDGFELRDGRCECPGDLQAIGGECQCGEGSYREGVTCFACSPHCQNCSSASDDSCTSCEAPKLLKNGSCYCPIGSYLTEEYQCNSCHFSCWECVSDKSDGCTACSAANQRILNEGSCVCEQGTYDDGKPACEICNSTMPGCVKCGSPTICLACATGSSLTNNDCVCEAGQYVDGNGCHLCSETMLGCTDCQSGSVCTTCNLSLRFRLDSNGRCVCRHGYSHFEGGCEPSTPISIRLANHLTKGAVVAGYGLLLMGHLLPGGLATIELMHCLQTSSVSARLINNPSIVMEPFDDIAAAANGVYRPTDQERRLLQETPPYQKTFLANFNVMLIVQMVVVVTGLLLSLTDQQPKDNDRPTMASLISTFLLSDVLYIWVVFSSFSYAMAVGIYFRSLFGGGYSAGSIFVNILAMLLGAGFLYASFRCSSRGNLSTRLKSPLKDDAHRYLNKLIRYRLIFGLVVGLTGGFEYRAELAFILRLVYFVVKVKSNPFSTQPMANRHIYVEAISLVFVGFAVWCTIAPSFTNSVGWTYLLLALLLTCVVFTFMCLRDEIKKLLSEIVAEFRPANTHNAIGKNPLMQEAMAVVWKAFREMLH